MSETNDPITSPNKLDDTDPPEIDIPGKGRPALSAEPAKSQQKPGQAGGAIETSDTVKKR